MELIYHYTDINGLYGIIGEGEFWLTDHRFLNDHTEGHYAQTILEGFQGEILNDCKTEHHQAILTILYQEYRNFKNNRVYVGSFSEKNILSQWRGYCPKEGGYCIGFNKAKIRDIRPFQIATCNYNEHQAIKQWKQLASSINKKLEKYKRIKAIGPALSAEFTLEDSAWPLTIDSQVNRIRMTNKHPDYMDERETRIFRFVEPSSKHKIVNEELYVIKKRLDIRKTEVYFRKSKTGLVPYIKLENIENLIEKVHLGPQGNPELNELALEEFKIHNKKLKFDIEKSETPFR
ncbi:DUF2971 domain-containing protein [Microbulbifer sp. DLAB2-AA]|uniref:DUF2971 domain-containing protein n=1 Tax=Microbulbifer sp. DLAB2-AA TaxID=3243394 RepID=UPI00403A1AE5